MLCKDSSSTQGLTACFGSHLNSVCGNLIFMHADHSVGWLQPTSFELEEDTTGWPAYERGGLVTTVKEKKQLTFKTLEQGIAEPGEFLLSDFSKLERPALLHVGFQALDAFQVSSDSPPLFLP